MQYKQKYIFFTKQIFNNFLDVCIKKASELSEAFFEN